MFWCHVLGLRFHDIDFSKLKIQKKEGYCPIIMLGGYSEDVIYWNIINFIHSLKCSGCDDNLDKIMDSKRVTSGETYVIYVRKKPSSVNFQENFVFRSREKRATTFIEELVYVFKTIFDGKPLSSIMRGPVLCLGSRVNGKNCVPVITINKRGLPACAWKNISKGEGETFSSQEMVRQTVPNALY